MLKRVQILLEPGQHAALEREARRRDTSVAALVREAVDQRYAAEQAIRDQAYETIVKGPPLPVTDWPAMEEQLERARTRNIAKGMGHKPRT
jgi:hypothetical protein